MSTVSAIALSAPIIASNAIFSARRADRSADSMEENPMYAVANADIALAQVLKGGRAVKVAALTADSIKNTKNTEAAWKTLTLGQKVSRGAFKVLDFTANNINPVICATSGLNVLNQEDKVDALARESCALTTMFGAEHLVKEYIGMPTFSGKNEIIDHVGKYKNHKLVNDFVERVTSYCDNFTISNIKPLKHLPSFAKGLIFAGASIYGYKAGNFITDQILGKKEQNA